MDLDLDESYPDQGCNQHNKARDRRHGEATLNHVHDGPPNTLKASIMFRKSTERQRIVEMSCFVGMRVLIGMPTVRTMLQLARLSVTAIAPTTMKLTAQDVSRLSQLRPTKLSPSQ